MFLKNKVINNIILVEIKLFKATEKYMPSFSEKVKTNISNLAEHNFKDTLKTVKSP